MKVRKLFLAATLSIGLFAVAFSTFIIPGQALAKQSTPQYVQCKDTRIVVKNTGYGNAPGVKVQIDIVDREDIHTNAYCFEVAANAYVTTTTHTGRLETNLINHYEYDCRIRSDCAVISKNKFGIYGPTVSVNDNVKVCANGVFLDDNGKDVPSNTCWTTP